MSCSSKQHRAQVEALTLDLAIKSTTPGLLCNDKYVIYKKLGKHRRLLMQTAHFNLHYTQILILDNENL